jgi:hypothetical protein
VLQCSELENLEYGQLIINGYELNNTVLYLCNSGYDLVDGTKTRTCLFNQKWTGKAPTCKSKHFFDISIIKNFKINKAINKIKKSVSY